MIKPELFDIVELLVDIPQYNLKAGIQGIIVEGYNPQSYEVEFSNSQGETELTCALSTEQLIVVWKASTKKWLSVSEQAAILINRLSDSEQTKVLEFARSLYGK